MAASTPASAPAPVKVLFKAVGGAPIMKRNAFKIGGGENFGKIVGFLRKMLKLETSDKLFVYVNSAFIPSEAQQVADLHRNFHVSGQLQLFYARTPAWG